MTVESIRAAIAHIRTIKDSKAAHEATDRLLISVLSYVASHRRQILIHGELAYEALKVYED